jgi:hypothetical protein
MERPGKSTMAQRGVWGSALKLRARWAGDRQEAKVSTGRGESPPSGIVGGPRDTGRVWTGDPTPPSHERGWKPSTSGACARVLSRPNES